MEEPRNQINSKPGAVNRRHCDRVAGHLPFPVGVHLRPSAVNSSAKSGSRSCKFFGDEGATGILVQRGIISSGDTQTGISRHPIQSLGHLPFFTDAHLSESLDLERMEGFKLHGNLQEQKTLLFPHRLPSFYPWSKTGVSELLNPQKGRRRQAARRLRLAGDAS